MAASPPPIPTLDDIDSLDKNPWKYKGLNTCVALMQFVQAVGFVILGCTRIGLGCDNADLATSIWGGLFIVLAAGFGICGSGQDPDLGDCLLVLNVLNCTLIIAASLWGTYDAATSLGPTKTCASMMLIMLCMWTLEIFLSGTQIVFGMNKTCCNSRHSARTANITTQHGYPGPPRTPPASVTSHLGLFAISYSSPPPSYDEILAAYAFDQHRQTTERLYAMQTTTLPNGVPTTEQGSPGHTAGRGHVRVVTPVARSPVTPPQQPTTSNHPAGPISACTRTPPLDPRRRATSVPRNRTLAGLTARNRTGRSPGQREEPRNIHKTR